jgi:hypothetical protein
VKPVLNIRKHAICQNAALNLYFHMENKFHPFTPFLKKSFFTSFREN